MKKIISFLIAIIALYCCGCNKPSNTSQTVSIQDFPIAVGDKWVYQVTDETSSTVDTQTITVTNKTVYNSDSTVYNTQTVLNGVVVDSATIIMSPSTYAYYSYAPDGYYSLFKNLKLSFPINQGSHWTGSEGDSIFVLYTNQTNKVLNNTYTNVCQIKRELLEFDNNVISLVYIQPKVGIIYETVNVNFGYPVSSQSISLISYQLN